MNFDFDTLLTNARKTYHNDDQKNIRLEIALCVYNSLPHAARKRTFNALCNYCLDMWYKVEKFYVQLAADIVVDAYYKCYKYFTDGPKLSVKDLEDLNQIDDVVDLYLDKYYE